VARIAATGRDHSEGGKDRAGFWLPGWQVHIKLPRIEAKVEHPLSADASICT
jgi:hypothetical protein